jgi:hypothetical protein
MSLALANTLAPDNSSDVNFRAWVSGISTQLGAMGLVKSTETGEINLATVTRPLAVSTFQGFQIWKFADTLQGSFPIYIKIRYGSSNNFASTPGIQIDVGTGSDGAGNLTNDRTGAMDIRSNIAGNTTVQTCIWSGDTNRLGFCLFKTLTNMGMFLSIERTKDGNGADTGTGFYITIISQNNVHFGYVPFTGTVAAFLTSATNCGIFHPTTGSGVKGSDVYFPSSIFYDSGKPLAPGLNYLGYFNGDVTVDSSITVNQYSANHTFYSLGNTAPFSGISRGAISNSCLLIRYE